jgi:hypothetical protein
MHAEMEEDPTAEEMKMEDDAAFFLLLTSTRCRRPPPVHIDPVVSAGPPLVDDMEEELGPLLPFRR